MESKRLETIYAVRAGYVGTQIGLLCAVRGRSPWMVDISDEALKRTAQTGEKMLVGWLDPQQTAPSERAPVLSRINFTTGSL